MNERIKQLKRQAEEYASKYGIDHSVYGQDLIDVLDQKFAELIVQEACAVIKREDDVWDGICQRTIKKHFGVEA